MEVPSFERKLTVFRMRVGAIIVYRYHLFRRYPAFITAGNIKCN